MKINNRKKCEFIMEDGFRCNRPFSSRAGIVGNNSRYCEEHATNQTVGGLSRSSNTHAQAGNDAKMREWVMFEMNNKNRHGVAIGNINQRIDALRDLLHNEEKMEKIISKIVHKMVKEQSISNPQIERLESLIMKVNNKVIALEKGSFKRLELGQEEE